MNENQNSKVTQPASGANKTVGIGYSDHEYDKAINILVERVTPSNDQAEVNIPKARSRSGADGGKPDGLLYIPEVQDTFSCGVCGKLYNKLLPFLTHRIQHADAERSMSCELGDGCPVYNQPFRLREHYKKVHKLDLTEGTTQRSCRSTYRRKPSGGKGSPCVSPEKKQKTPKGKKSKGKQNVATTAPVSKTATISDVNQSGEENNLIGVMEESVSELEVPVPEGQIVPGDLNVESVTCSSLSNEQIVAAERGEIIQLGTVGPDGKIYDETYIRVVHEGQEEGQSSQTQKSAEPQQETELEQTHADTNDTGNNPSSNDKEKELDFYFLLVTSMVRGSKFMYGKQSFKCLHCDYKTFWKQAFIKHMKENHADVLSQHEFIEMRSTEKNDNQKLLKLSEFMDYQSSTKRREKGIGQRIKGKSVDKHGNYPCTSCSKVFSRWSYLRKHMRIHVPTRNFLCIECGKAFKTNTSLQQHLKTHQKEAYTCTVCGFKSNINAAIHAHRQFHSQGSVLCDICGNAYTDKSTLNKHKRVHDPNRPFGCPYPDCTWRFKTEVMCNGHYRSHTSNAQFRCTLCGYDFRQKHHLRRHERQTHGIQHIKSRVQRLKVKAAEEEQAITNITVLQQSPDPNQITDVVEPVGPILIPVMADGEGNPIQLTGYKMGTLGSVNMSYQQVITSDFNKVDGNTIYIPLS